MSSSIVVWMLLVATALDTINAAALSELGEFNSDSINLKSDSQRSFSGGVLSLHR